MNGAKRLCFVKKHSFLLIQEHWTNETVTIHRLAGNVTAEKAADKTQAKRGVSYKRRV